MRLRVCNGEGERIEPASVTAVERVFAPGTPIGAGTEVSVTDGGVSLVAVAIDTYEGNAEDEVVQFLLSTINPDHASLAGPLRRSEVLRLFRQFVLTAVTETAGPNERVFP